VQIGGGILKQVSEAYRKLRGTLRFLLGNLADYDPVQHAVPYKQLPAVDRWLLAKHAELMAEVQEAYDTYQVGGGCYMPVRKKHLVQKLCASRHKQF
jgi:isoleucyl-tRNA synthetase